MSDTRVRISDFNRVPSPRHEVAGDAVSSLALDGLLDEVATFVRRYVVMDTPQLVAVVLWVALTHSVEAFDVTPYLAITSPVKQSGKTRLLDTLELVVARVWRAIQPSEAVVFRKIARDAPTLLLDEVDAIFGKNREHEGLRALLNAGNARGTKVPRCVGPSQKLVEFAVFGPKALAGIGALPETVADRSIPIAMQRKTPGEPCARFRRRYAISEAGPLREGLARWGQTASKSLQATFANIEPLADDDQPLAVLQDRAFEAWEPLLAIATLAGETWKQAAIDAALVLSADREAETESLGVRLLADVRTIFDSGGRSRIASAALVDELAADADSPWADWYGKAVTQRAVAKLLSTFGIRPGTVRLQDGTTPKGYKREQFEEAWKRYSQARDATQPPQPAQPSRDAALRLFPDPTHAPAVADTEAPANADEHDDVAHVAVEPVGTASRQRGSSSRTRGAVCHICKRQLPQGQPRIVDDGKWTCPECVYRLHREHGSAPAEKT
jgi:hypothetical protein